LELPQRSLGEGSGRLGDDGEEDAMPFIAGQETFHDTTVKDTCFRVPFGNQTWVYSKFHLFLGEAICKFGCSIAISAVYKRIPFTVSFRVISCHFL
jgi:23S rRNA pseudoU1915 N3-methylase RlmH